MSILQRSSCLRKCMAKACAAQLNSRAPRRCFHSLYARSVLSRQHAGSMQAYIGKISPPRWAELCRAKVHVHAAMGMDETIFALSSAPGRSGVAVIRISGPSAGDTICALTGRKTPPTPRVATVQALRDPRTRQTLDIAMLIYFKGPKSFTGEDSAELHVHGSPAVVEEVLECLSKQTALRPALPGEFTRRALLNGKLGLLEAEGLADLIAADTSIQRRMALQQLSGASTAMYDRWRDELIKCLAHVEAFIDFGEDDEISTAAMLGARERAMRVLTDIEGLVATDNCGEVLRTGVEVVLTGPPNAGKSSLLNALSRRQAAIVSPVAGTTRDIVEVRLNMRGVLVIMKDTAGLRNAAADVVESEGIVRALAAYHKALLRILVLDASQALRQLSEVRALVSQEREQERERKETAERGGAEGCDRGGGPGAPHRSINRHLGPAKEGEAEGEGSGSWVEGGLERRWEGAPARSPTLVLLNKIDTLGVGGEAEAVVVRQVEEAAAEWLGREGVDVRSVSCVTGHGMDAVIEAVQRSVDKATGASSSALPLLTRPRHRYHLALCADSLRAFVLEERTVDMAAEQLRVAVRHLGAISGSVGVEEMLETLFRDFCIGK